MSAGGKFQVEMVAAARASQVKCREKLGPTLGSSVQVVPLDAVT